MQSVGRNEHAAKGERLVVRRKPLDLTLFAPFRGEELPAALAALRRIRAFWNAALPNPWFCAVPEDDQGLYQTLTHDLYFCLGQRPEYGVVTDEFRTLVPASLPDNDLALALDQDLRADILDKLSRARHILNDLLIAEGGSFGPNRAESLFELFDSEIAFFAADSKRQANALAAKLGFLDSYAANGQPDAPCSYKIQTGTLTRAQRRAADRQAKARKLRKQGLTIKEIARELGCAERSVYSYLSDLQ